MGLHVLSKHHLSSAEYEHYWTSVSERLSAVEGILMFGLAALVILFIAPLVLLLVPMIGAIIFIDWAIESCRRRDDSR